eukprot:TRINITY_DN16493_c0_g1_i1.p1 TRINITY_DN16493_c0_g1~~TRINITY_DN16493_c0_g1_i1.p1  ORF type:complete len:242 (+),score=40.60 TRINITY_DN16493_c0_g1_i1:93-818(+)
MLSSRGKQSGLDLLSTITNKELCLQYFSYMQDQRCEENLLFWVEVQLLKIDCERSSMDGEKIMSRNEKIWNKYFSSAGQFSLNIDWEVYNSIEYQLFHKEDGRLPTLFERAQKDVYTLMFNDSFIKFKLANSKRDRELKMGRGVNTKGSPSTDNINEAPSTPRSSSGAFSMLKNIFSSKKKRAIRNEGRLTLSLTSSTMPLTTRTTEARGALLNHNSTLPLSSRICEGDRILETFFSRQKL